MLRKIHFFLKIRGDFPSILHSKLKTSLKIYPYLHRLAEIIFFTLFFPIVLPLTKFVTIFNAENMELRSLSMAMKGIEGNYEATFQLTLQLFISFTNLERNPSVIQILTILFSFLSVTTSVIDAIFSLDPAASTVTRGAAAGWLTFSCDLQL